MSRSRGQQVSPGVEPAVAKQAPLALSFGALALIGCAALYLALYARAATLDVAYADYLLPPFITAVDACMSGRGCMDALLAPTSNGYRWTVPALLLSVNARLFGLTTRFDLALGIAGLVLAASTLYLWLATTWMRSVRPYTVLAVLLPCLLFLFNLNQWENIVLGLGGYHLLGLAALLPCLWAIDYSLRAPRIATTHAIVLFSALALSSVFLLQYFVVMMAAGSVLALVALVIGYPQARTVLGAILAGSAVGLLVTLVPAAAVGPSATAGPGLGDLPSAGRFFLNMLAAAMLQWEGKRVVADSGYVLGPAAMIAIAVSIWLFLSQGMYRESWLPLALCIYGLLGCLVISLARFRYGPEYGFASRYTSQTVLGFLGCYLILVKALQHRTAKQLAIGIVAVFCLAAAALQVATHVVQWQIAPHRKAYYLEVARIAANFEQASDSELALFQIPLEATRHALPILRRHRLGFFR